MKKIVVTLIISAFFFSLGFSWYVWDHFVNRPASDSKEEVIFEVAPGKSFKAVAKELEIKGLVKSSELFTLFARIKNEGGKIKVGEYLLTKNMTPSGVMAVITSGKSIERKITISEGLSIYEIADIFEQAEISKREDFLKLVQDPELIKSLIGEGYRSLEGYLFPETYSFTKYTGIKAIVTEMVKKFQAVYKEIEPAASKVPLSKHQIVTLASIIEKETGAPQERPMISSVFHNRLDKGMRLQTDPTIIYGKALQSQKIEIKISKTDITTPTEYNTYVIKGLPPGPIANPGKEALLAAVSPAQSDYLFFVSQNDGTHIFSKDYGAHQKAVGKFQVDPKSRQGKSWRDLSKKKSQN
ncbi:MAG: aminodeoxychorismate lyase [Oligoflexia bacterium]|nr:MAG: aminodeoxychorismate lyase [Oligoflexia bacterium]